MVFTLSRIIICLVNAIPDKLTTEAQTVIKLWLYQHLCTIHITVIVHT